MRIWCTVAAILDAATCRLHELAHTNGAGVALSKAASAALKFCGLAALYDGAVGAAPRARRDTDERYA